MAKELEPAERVGEDPEVTAEQKAARRRKAIMHAIREAKAADPYDYYRTKFAPSVTHKGSETESQVQTLEFEHFEAEDDGGLRMSDFDVITRRYLNYCQFKGLDIEDFIPGLKQEEVNEHMAALSHDRRQTEANPNASLQRTTVGNKTQFKLNTAAGKEGEEFGETYEALKSTLDEQNLLDGSIHSTQHFFGEQFKKLRQYDAGTVFFYEEEGDMRAKQFTNNMSLASDHADLDYDLALINELFPREPDKVVRVSKDHNADGASYRDAEHSDSDSFGQEKAIREMEDMAEDLMLLEQSPRANAQKQIKPKRALFGRGASAHAPRSARSASQSTTGRATSVLTKASRVAKNLEFFRPIERKKHRRELGTSLQAMIFKKIKGTKDFTVPSDSVDNEKYGQIIFTGNVKKQRGNLQGDMHTRWVVMRGWQLYWYRQPGDQTQKGILTLPSHDIIVKEGEAGSQRQRISFTLPRQEATGAERASRAMSFGDDYNTRFFRTFVSNMIKYKLYAEHVQKEDRQTMEPALERFLKVDKKLLATPYRELVDFSQVDLSDT